jgi:hypothetical protein
LASLPAPPTSTASVPTAQIVLAALGPAARWDRRLARPISLLAYSAGDLDGLDLSDADNRWCERALGIEIARARRLMRGISAPGL